jgi:DNA-directed RNA polymerase specialized sigma subunit
LWLGTNLDNILDSVNKGRRKGITRKRPKGLKYRTKNTHGEWHCKLSEEQKKLVYQMSSTGMKQREIGNLVDLSQSAISRMLKKRSIH